MQNTPQHSSKSRHMKTASTDLTSMATPMLTDLQDKHPPSLLHTFHIIHLKHLTAQMPAHLKKFLVLRTKTPGMVLLLHYGPPLSHILQARGRGSRWKVEGLPILTHHNSVGHRAAASAARRAPFVVGSTTCTSMLWLDCTDEPGGLCMLCTIGLAVACTARRRLCAG